MFDQHRLLTVNYNNGEVFTVSAARGRMVIAVQRFVDQPVDIQKAQDIVDNKYSWTLDQPLCVLQELSRNYKECKPDKEVGDVGYLFIYDAEEKEVM